MAILCTESKDKRSEKGRRKEIEITDVAQGQKDRERKESERSYKQFNWYADSEEPFGK